MLAITGANGLLGSFIVRRLVAANEPFVALKRANSNTALLDDIRDKITWRDADVMDTDALTEAFAGVTHVIHTAAIVTFNRHRAGEVFDVNVVGTRNVVNVCLALNIKRLVHISSVAALGRQKNVDIISEESRWTDSSMNSIYAESKYLAELEVFRGQEEGLDTAIINPSLILAPADWDRSSAQVFRYVWKQKPFYIDGYLNYVDVRDVADVVYRLLRHKASGERFIASADNISYADFFARVAKKLARKPPHIKIPRKILRVGAVVEELRSRLFGTEPALTRERARAAGSRFLYDNRKTRNVLNFEFQPIDATLDWCCEYYIAKLAGKK